MTKEMHMRAKFRCHQITDSADSTEKTAEIVKLVPVYSVKDGSANAQWAKYTPAGSIEMVINNPNAWGFLKVGKEYFIDFSEASIEE